MLRDAGVDPPSMMVSVEEDRIAWEPDMGTATEPEHQFFFSLSVNLECA